jgi:hypothetical protein
MSDRPSSGSGVGGHVIVLIGVAGFRSELLLAEQASVRQTLRWVNTAYYEAVTSGGEAHSSS